MRKKKGQKNPFKRVFQGVTNSAVLLDKKGAVSYIYDKIHLVPFGEYVPLKNILPFLNNLVSGGKFIPGDSFIRAVAPFELLALSSVTK